MLRNHDLNLLPIFDALMREQHLSRAAERLNMSQPAVSNALKRLRLSYEDDLFVRTGHGLKPTQRAMELHKRIAPALVEIRDSFEDADFVPETFSRTINISMNHAAEYLWAAALLRHLRAVAPKLTWKIHPDIITDIPARMKDGSLTYALDYSPLPGRDFGSLLLVNEPLTLIAAADHPRIGTSVTLEDFETLPQVSLMRRSEWIRSQNSRRHTPLEFLMGDALPRRNIEVQVSSFLSIPSIVADTDLIAVVPQRLALPLQAKGRLRCLALPFDCPNVDMYLHWHRSRDNDPVHIWLLNLLQGLAKTTFG
ncbi:MAG: LysR substrate-binding domain-containing protein [Pelagimonas sp.]|jgi:DNA-binding transcriptional LysR family regulator|nr:LysR substrate-binding domain-containing protein [Pelagimonas sp.]